MYQLIPTLDTGAYASGDVLFNFVRIEGLAASKEYFLQSFSVIDASDSGVDMTLLFAGSALDLGTVNSAVSISDSDALQIYGALTISNYISAWIDLGGAKIATVVGGGLVLPSPLYVAGIAGGTATYTASSLTLNLALMPVM